jgi:hypothetical protein
MALSISSSCFFAMAFSLSLCSLFALAGDDADCVTSS